MLEEVNFSIVSHCNANCVFCPRPEFKSQVKFMPLELVRKIMDEITEEGFKYKIVNSYVGENGEATLHPDFLSIVREINRGGYKVDMYTNFSNLTEDKSKVIIEENLFSCIHTNIDGLSKDSYGMMKGLDYDRMEENIMAFLNLRKTHPLSSHIKLYIHIITAERYIDAVSRYFKTYPHKLPKSL